MKTVNLDGANVAFGLAGRPTAETASISMAYFQRLRATMWLLPTIEVCVLTAPGPLNSTAGSLFVVATPIGNLDDISARALKVLRDVKLIAAEDTRHSQRLMQHFGISTPLAACHEHNEREEGSVLSPACWPVTMWR